MSVSFSGEVQEKTRGGAIDLQKQIEKYRIINLRKRPSLLGHVTTSVVYDPRSKDFFCSNPIFGPVVR